MDDFSQDGAGELDAKLHDTEVSSVAAEQVRILPREGRIERRTSSDWKICGVTLHEE